MTSQAIKEIIYKKGLLTLLGSEPLRVASLPLNYVVSSFYPCSRPCPTKEVRFIKVRTRQCRQTCLSMIRGVRPKGPRACRGAKLAVSI